ncbi:GtrA family protein [Halorarum salinum]|uniref:GtrA family protein n=1 Tax=Halorarum salinum TaxID=2743089 RepID=A0A7D5QJ79_9EURY|nr:GtrA family protein [Halobaculum salinum]QLG61225.1 GtrA family protein [Halobaculum salinum]
MATPTTSIDSSTVGRLARFVTVGASAAAIQTALLWAFVEFGGLNYLVGAAIAIEITIVLQYVANNAWTFSASQHTGRGEYLRGLFRTNVVRGSAIPIQLGLLAGFVQWVGLAYVVANLCAILVSGVYRYLLDARWTWQ